MADGSFGTLAEFHQVPACSSLDVFGHVDQIARLELLAATQAMLDAWSALDEASRQRIRTKANRQSVIYSPSKGGDAVIDQGLEIALRRLRRAMGWSLPLGNEPVPHDATRLL